MFRDACVLSPRRDVMLEPYQVQRKYSRIPWFGVGPLEQDCLGLSTDISPCELWPVAFQP